MPRELDLPEFTARFVAEIVRLAGPTFSDGESIEAYARETAESYWTEQHGFGETPEDCAQSDLDCWE